MSSAQRTLRFQPDGYSCPLAGQKPSVGLIAGNFLKALVFLVLLIALIDLIILYIYRSESDYYEDVLRSASEKPHH